MDKRRLKRRQLIYYLKVVDQSTGNVVGRLVDITTEGVMLFGEKPLLEGQAYELKLLLPQDMEHLGPLVFEATCVWTGPDVNQDFFDSGLKFKRVSSKDVQTISDLIDEYELPD